MICSVTIPFFFPLCVLAVKEAGGSKSIAYAEITSKFRPVFHHFFMEKFPTPPQWFERRLAYTRSVAASSMGKSASPLSVTACMIPSWTVKYNYKS